MTVERSWLETYDDLVANPVDGVPVRLGSVSRRLFDLIPAHECDCEARTIPTSGLCTGDGYRWHRSLPVLRFGGVS